MKCKKVANGDYYIISTPRRFKIRKYKSWFLVKHNYSKSSDRGYVSFGIISFPPEFVGKKIALRVETLRDRKGKK